MATLTIGGNDIDFPGILFNCILESHLLTGGPPFRTCDDQRAHTWGLIRDPSLVTSISTLIGQIVTKGRAGQAGDRFRLYVTGYGQFFNNVTTACNDVTFARTANPTPDGKPHVMMTNEIRTEFNTISVGLNSVIKAAVAENAQNGVIYININGPLPTHRFCEEGVNEPNQNNPKLWLFHYPYNQQPGPSPETGSSGPDYSSLVEAAKNKVYGTASITQFRAQYPDARSVDDAFYNTLNQNALQALSGGVDAAGFWDSIGSRAKLFHPQIEYHNWIQDSIIKQWKQDRDIDSTGASSITPSAPGPTAPPEPPARWSYEFHSYTGNLAKGEFSFMVLPGKYNGNIGNSKRTLQAGISEVRDIAVEDHLSHPHYRRSLSAGLNSSTAPGVPLNKRMGCCGAPPPKFSGKVWVWTQNGDGATQHGPFDLDCTQPQDAWQSFNPTDTGLPLYLVLQSGHACAFNPADDGNLDNLHAKYGAQYMDIPTGVNSRACVKHDNGVICSTFQQ